MFRCESESWYTLAREQALLLAVNCTRAGGTCFCTSWGTGPLATEGFDLALTELRSGFVVQVGSERGQELIERLSLRPANTTELELAELKLQRAAERMGRSLDTHGVKELLDQNIEHPQWDKVARRCLSCWNCTMVCPTCFCCTFEDSTHLQDDPITRTRHWESCFTHQFSSVTTGPERNTIRGRPGVPLLRHRNHLCYGGHLAMPGPNIDAVQPRGKLKLAAFKFTSCDGCQLQILNLEGDLLQLAETVEIDFFLEARRRQGTPPYDIGFVEGSISTPQEEDRIRQVRRECKTLITIGACATSGGIQAGRHPNISTHSVCIECKRNGHPCVLVSQGKPCLGPITQVGCGGALCPDHDRACYGCFGPMEQPNMSSLGRWFTQRLGFDARDMTRMLRMFNGYLEPFKQASDHYEQAERDQRAGGSKP